MAVSFGMLGILVMLDVCFIVNYFVVRSLRQWTNRVLRQERRKQRRKEAQRIANGHSSDVFSNNLQGVYNYINDVIDWNYDITFAWLLGTVKLDPLRVKKFPDWSPIPWNLGIWTTCIFISLTTILLSPDLVTDQLGVSLATLDADLCVTDIKESGVEELRRELLHMTRFNEAKKQYELMTSIHHALINDTALYGVPPYQCPSIGDSDVTGYKDDWDTTTTTQRGSSRNNNGPFFPSYCDTALQAALEAAQTRECITEICDCPILPDSAIFEFTGYAGEKFCGAQVCIEVPYPCPSHSADLDETLDSLYNSNMTDYRFQQYQFAEQRRRTNLNLTGSFPTSVASKYASPATQTAEKVMWQVEVASYLYIAYQCLSLFFPSPLILFRMPWWSGIKRYLFGVQKPHFICVVVAIWWGIEYFRGIWYSPDIRLFVNNLRAGDPCFVDADYLLERQYTLNSICEELMPMKPQFEASTLTVIDVLREIQHFDTDCNCGFPNQYLSQVKQAFMSNATYVGFTDTLDLCDGGYEFDGDNDKCK